MLWLKSSCRIIFLIGLSFGVGVRVSAQVDCVYGFKISVTDEARQKAEGVMIEVTELNHKTQLPNLSDGRLPMPEGTYFVGVVGSGTTLPGDYRLRVTADGFKPFEWRFKFPVCEIQRYELRLKAEGSPGEAEFERLFTVHGKVFDEDSKPFNKASVEASVAGGKVYRALSNAYGYYEIGLPKGMANIRVKGEGIPDAVFESFVVDKNYAVLNVPVCRKCGQKEPKN